MLHQQLCFIYTKYQIMDVFFFIFYAYIFEIIISCVFFYFLENWGPHLIVVPTSVMLNWEMEIKKWCPGFKILTYYGSQKERKLKRCGWTKPDAFHVCITSYKLVVQDHQSFRRKKWKYLILDEAQNIKNFKSQRWQMLLNFQTQQ